jgi:hypothetical protein
MIKNILNDLIDKNSTRNLSIKKILKKTHDNKKNSMIYIYIYIFFLIEKILKFLFEASSKDNSNMKQR